MKKQTKLGLVLAAAAVISVSVASLVSAKGWVQQNGNWYYVNSEGDYVTETIQTSGSAKFYLGEDGSMQRDYFLEDYGSGANTYYFGQNGAMVTNTWVAIESSNVSNTDGDYIPDNYWYYFQSSGKAMKGTDATPKKATIDGKKYLFNQYGQMCVGWVDENGQILDPDSENPFADAAYYCGGDNDGVLRSGWVTYYDGYDSSADTPHADKTNLYFYFATNNNKKAKDETKKINGRTYAFDQEGVMLSGFDLWDSATNGVAVTNLAGKKGYFSGEDDGHQVKMGWVYTVPSEDINASKNADDEEAYMYFDKTGEIVKNQIRKINGKDYLFDLGGVMQTGVVVWAPSATNKYVIDLDLDFASGEDIAKKGIIAYGEGDKKIEVDPTGKVLAAVSDNDITVPTAAGATAGAEHVIAPENTMIKLHLFGEDGARKVGSNVVKFSDDDWVLYTNNSGDKGTGLVSKKYYSLGLLLKASSDIRYGIYNVEAYSNAAGPFHAQKDAYFTNLATTDATKGYIVLNTSGAKVKGSNTAKKDADGYYWFIDSADSKLKGIWTNNVKSAKLTKFITKTFTSAKPAVTPTDGVDHPSNIASLEGNIFATGATTGDLQNTPLATAANWVIKTDATTGGWYGEYSNNDTRQYLQFQTDYDGSSNKWIPFGMLDDNGNTIKKTGTATDPYVVVPNNDYFLNCVWTVD